MSPGILVENICTGGCDHIWIDEPGERRKENACPECGSSYWDSNNLTPVEATQ